MSEQPIDSTTTSGLRPDDQLTESAQVSGGPVDRMDKAGDDLGGVPAAGADGITAEREALRKGLGERGEAAGEETGDDLEQAAAIGETDDPQGGSIQEHGAQG
jgi:hypothetical protein